MKKWGLERPNNILKVTKPVVVDLIWTQVCLTPHPLYFRILFRKHFFCDSWFLSNTNINYSYDHVLYAIALEKMGHTEPVVPKLSWENVKYAN